MAARLQVTDTSKEPVEDMAKACASVTRYQTLAVAVVRGEDEVTSSRTAVSPSALPRR